MSIEEELKELRGIKDRATAFYNRRGEIQLRPTYPSQALISMLKIIIEGEKLESAHP